MTFERIEALLRAAEGRGLAALEFAEDGAALRVVFRQNFPGAAQAPEAARGPRREAAPPGIVAPCVGFLRLRHPASAAMPVPGEAISAGSIVAFVQAGPLLHPVAATRAGVLGPALVADGAPVGYGMPLFALS